MASAATVDRIGTGVECVGACGSLDDERTNSFHVNNGNYTTFWNDRGAVESAVVVVPAYDQIISAKVAFNGTFFTSASLVNVSVAHSGSDVVSRLHVLTVTNSSAINSSRVYVKTNHSFVSEINYYAYDFGENEYELISSCFDFCSAFAGTNAAFGWSSNYTDSTGQVVINVSAFDLSYGNLSGIWNVTFEYGQSAQVSFLRNVSFFIDGNISKNHTVTISDINFSGTGSVIDFTSSLLLVLPSSSDVQESVSFTPYGVGQGYLDVGYFSVVYTPKNVGGTGIPVEEEELSVIDLIAQGATFKQIAVAWNPSVYPQLLEKFNSLSAETNLETFVLSFKDLGIIFVRYVLREPAALVPYGGLQ